jgi:hypothetical protein
VDPAAVVAGALIPQRIADIGPVWRGAPNYKPPLYGAGFIEIKTGAWMNFAPAPSCLL